MKDTKALVLSGFLGSGKTTLLLQLIQGLRKDKGPDYTIAIIENEIGAVSVDGGIISEAGYSVTDMLSGCACCTLLAEIPYALEQIKEDLDPDLVIFEATGLANPRKIASMMKRACDIPGRVCTLVDAPGWEETFECLENLVTAQVQAADVVCINKVDLADEEVISAAEADICKLNDRCDIVRMVGIEPLEEGLAKRILEG